MKTKALILFLSAACLLGIVSCKKSESAPRPFTVEGETDSTLNSKMAYLYDQSTNRKLDSVVVDSNKFVFKGVVDSVRYGAVVIDRKAAFLIIDTGKIVVDMKKRNASGSYLNEVLANYNKELSEIQKERYTLYMNLKEEIKDEKQLNATFDSIAKSVWLPKFTGFLDKTFEANANNIMAAVVANDMLNIYRTGQMDTVFSKLGKDVAGIPLIVKIKGTNEALKKTAEGQKFIDFTIEQPDGTKASLSDYAGKGKYLLVDFWASWCGPCRGETPYLKEIYSKHKGDKFELLGVAVWDKLEKSQKAIEEDKMTWPQILDAGELPAKLYGIRGIPHIILIGPDGTIIARNLRGDEMKERVDEELSK